MQFGLANTQISYFSLGFSLIVLGGGLLLKAGADQVLRIMTRRIGIAIIINKVFVTLAGLSLVAYWVLPFDVLARLGLPRFQGGIEIFFLAGLMMVLGTAWVLLTNAELLVYPLLALCARLPGWYILTRLASAYPLNRRFRTGISVVMFVMAVITNAMQDTYTNIDTQTGGYDIQAVAYFKPLPNLQSALLQHGINPADSSSL